MLEKVGDIFLPQCNMCGERDINDDMIGIHLIDGGMKIVDVTNSRIHICPLCIKDIKNLKIST